MIGPGASPFPHILRLAPADLTDVHLDVQELLDELRS
jgi:hypothetical protein